jgi:hypothetical protein
MPQPTERSVLDYGERVQHIEQFCLDEIRFYTIWSRVNRTLHVSFQTFSLILAAFVPVLILGQPHASVRNAIISTIAWIFASLDHGFAFSDNGNRKAMTKLALLLELTSFRSRTNQYASSTDEDALSTFVARITNIIQSSAKKWQKIVESSARQFKHKAGSSDAP